MQQYYDLYLLSDVLCLADVFENFRHSVFEQHSLNCRNYITLQSFFWAVSLKRTGVELKFLTDQEAYFIVERGMRGSGSLHFLT